MTSNDSTGRFFHVLLLSLSSVTVLRSECRTYVRDKLPLMLSHFPPTFATDEIIQFPSLRSQVLAGLPVKPVLYGKNCHVPCAIGGAAICPPDLSWRAGNFFRVARARCCPPRFLPRGIRLIAGRSFRGRIEDELSSRWNALANGAHARKSSGCCVNTRARPVPYAANNASALVTLGAYL